MQKIMLQYVQYWMDQRLEFQQGDNSVHVAWINGVLADYGVMDEWNGKPGSLFDDNTVECLKRFQEKHNRQPTGRADVFTMRDLQREWVIAGLKTYGINDELEGTAPQTFFELQH